MQRQELILKKVSAQKDFEFAEYFGIFCINPILLCADNTAAIDLIKANKITLRFMHADMLLCFMHSVHQKLTFVSKC